jgi:transcriptional regulator with XRE-family HTH domain
VDFGLDLRRVRMAANMSQEALADAAGVSAVAISAYERGVRKAPRNAALSRLADALQLVADERDAFVASAKNAHGERSEAKEVARLPAEASSFVGRDAEMLSLRGRTRLRRLTILVGPAGVGKSRLATAFASLREADGFTAAFVNVKMLRSGPSLARRIASAAREPAASIIVLDACDDRVPEVTSAAQALMASVNDSVILATCREAPGVSEEDIFRVLPFDVATTDPKTIDEGLANPSIRLFIERAQSYQPSFSLTLDRLIQVAEICRMLKGVPLAIELAAARLPSMGLGRLRLRLAGEPLEKR